MRGFFFEPTAFWLDETSWAMRLFTRPLVGRSLGVAADGAAPESLREVLEACPAAVLMARLADLGVTLGMKSGDTGPVSASRPPTVLITTPESTDSLLTRGPRLFAPLRAIVLDEVHLFDGGVRGDHLRCLLRRIETVRRHRQGAAGVDPPIPLQRIALSATIPDPAGVASRYLTGDERDAAQTRLVEAGGGRQIEAEVTPMAGLDDLVTALALRAGQRLGIYKILVFCNTRNEVEQTAAYLRQQMQMPVRMTLMTVIEEEITAMIGAGRYEHKPERSDQRNGTYRKIAT